MRLTGISAAGGLVGGCLETCVAETAITALGDQNALADLGEVADQRFAVFLVELRPNRYLHDRVGTTSPVAVAAHAVHARLGAHVGLIAEVDERVQPFDGLRPNIAAFAAIAAVRPAELNVFLAVERHGPAPACAGADIDLGLVEKFHGNEDRVGGAPTI